MPKPREQNYAEWLERELDRGEVSETDFETVRTLQDRLASSLYGASTSFTRGKVASAASAMMSAAEQKFYQWRERGINGRTITFPWGRQLRYLISGRRGWWGYQSASQAARERGWRPSGQL